MKTTNISGQIRPDTIFEDLTRNLDPYKKRKAGSMTFLVDSSSDNRVKIFIKYPGRKVLNRNLKQSRTNSVHWDFLYDFLVIPEFKGKMLDERELTYRKILADFDEHKKQDEEFWLAVLNLLEKNVVSEDKFSHLKGIDGQLFLYVLKWLWLQEDLNYRINHMDFKSPTRYRLPKGKSLGRKKFFASLLLVRTPYFNAKECSKLFS